jgi:guanine nucleotide exchange factor VAV
MGIQELFTTHTGFHSALQQATSNAHANKTIASCFIEWKPKFLLYGEFCSNLPKAQELVDELCKRDEAIRRQIDECQQKANDGKFRLRDLLSVPMQRVLKYHLLLRELIKNTDRVHPERESLERALEAMQDLSLYVNEVKRDNAALQLIKEIQNSITDLQMPENTTFKDYGKLLKDGELKVKSHEDNRQKTRYIFLFDKVMLMCKSKIVDKLLWVSQIDTSCSLVTSLQ